MGSSFLAAVVAVFLMAAGLGADLAVRNGGFEEAPAGEATPAGWSTGRAARDGGYQFNAASGGAYAGERFGRVALSPAAAAKPGSFGPVSQTVDAAAYRGHRIRFTAAARVVEASDPGALWLRIDGAEGRMLFLDNMGDRPITGGDWQTYTIEAYVPSQATSVVLGFMLLGQGEFQFDAVQVADLGPATGAPTGEAKAYLDRAISLLRQHHFNSDKVDWPAVEKDAYVAAGGATTPAQTYGAIRGVIGALGERHTFLRPPMKPRVGEVTPDGKVATATPALPVGRLSGRVAVVALPSWMGDLKDSVGHGMPYQTAISDFIGLARSKGACGWIIDLRGHGGGDMWPGMRALTPLLGDGPYGAFVWSTGRDPWMAEQKASPAAAAPVAILLGPNTASSGEMIAIAFVGRPLTRTFGQPTGGFTTANSSFPMSDGAVLAITSSRVEDRAGHLYDGPMKPDVETPLDEAEAAAMSWLAGQGCGATA